MKVLDRHGWYLFGLMALGAGLLGALGLWALSALKALAMF
jgi:hypothetical protein